MDNEYYSLEAILAENQKIACTFNLDIPELGHLDNSADEDLKSGTKLQLPYWLAPTILYAGWAGFNVPTAFSQRVQNALIAESRSVKLSQLVGENGRWYAFGKLIIDLMEDAEAKELADTLKTTFKQRIPDIMDQAQHFTRSTTSTKGPGTSKGGAGGGMGVAGGSDVGSEFRSGLEASERELFLLAQESAQQMKAWYESSDKVQ